MADYKKVTDMRTADKPTSENEAQLLFGKANYVFVLVGIFFIIIGFLLMSGGGSSDPTVFNVDAIYHPRRITLAPILILLGFVIEIYAIVKKP